MGLGITPPIPAKTSHNQQVETDYDAHVISPGFANDCSAYRDLFFGVTGIAEAIDYANLPSDVRTHATLGIWGVIDAAVTAGEVEDFASYPADYPADPWLFANTAILCALTRAEAIESWLAKITHAMMHDIAGTFPWRLVSYSSEELAELFDPTELYDGWDLGDTATSQSYLLDNSPYQAYAAATVYHGTLSNKLTLLDTFLYDFMANFIHSGGSDPVGVIGIEDVLIETPPYGENPWRARHGCHSAARILRAVLHSINVPATQISNYYDGAGHASLLISTVNRVLAHGDDVYSVDENRHDSGLFILDYYDDWAANILPLTPGEDSPELKQKTRYRAALREYDNLRDWHQTYFCSNGWDYIKGLTEEYMVAAGEEWRLDKYETDLMRLTGCDGSPP